MTNEEIHRYVIEKIRLARISKGLSQLEVCTRGNFSQSFYTHVESGRNQPSLMTIIRIAEVLETNPREFFPESEIKSKSEIKKEIAALLEALYIRSIMFFQNPFPGGKNFNLRAFVFGSFLRIL